MKKLKSQSGLTFVELLVTLLIATLVSGLLVTGISMAYRVYRSEADYSQSTVLLDTLTTAISNELRYATGVEVVNSDSITYQFKNDDATYEMLVNSGYLQIQKKYKNEIQEEITESRQPLSNPTYTKKKITSNPAVNGAAPDRFSYLSGDDHVDVTITLDTGMSRTFRVYLVNLMAP